MQILISSSNSFLSKVCDGTTSVAEPCDELCGGAGCNQCGGISCLKGALSKAEDSVKSATAADEMLVEKDRKAAQVCNNYCQFLQLEGAQYVVNIDAQDYLLSGSRC